MKVILIESFAYSAWAYFLVLALMNDCQQAHQAIVIYRYRFLGMRGAFLDWLSIRISPGTGSSFCAMY